MKNKTKKQTRFENELEDEAIKIYLSLDPKFIILMFPELEFTPINVAAILGSIKTAKKAESSRKNGLLGGRPRKRLLPSEV